MPDHVTSFIAWTILSKYFFEHCLSEIYKVRDHILEQDRMDGKFYLPCFNINFLWEIGCDDAKG
jgi:hypothetical protein